MKTVLAILLALVIVLYLVQALAARRFNGKIRQEAAALLTGGGMQQPDIITPGMITGLPAPVQRWLRHAGIIGTEAIQTVRLKQTGRMRLKPEQHWIRCSAAQYFNMARPAFVWNVSLRMNPLMPVRGRDKFVDGKGSMDIRLWSLIPVAQAANEKVDEGALQRYLGELCWAPSAALSPYIRWEEVNDTVAKATMSYKGTKGAVCYHISDSGEVTGCTAMRYKDAGPEAVREQWGVKVTAYGERAGIRMPVAMEVTWYLKNGPFTWYQLELTDLDYNKPSLY